MLSRRMVCGAILIAMVLSLAAGCAGAASKAAAADDTPAMRSITVVGSGKASGAPDVAYISIGIGTRDALVQNAVEANNAQMKAILDALKALGIADKDLRTSNYSIYAESREPIAKGSGEEATVIYHVSNQVAVTVRDLAKLSEVLDKAVAAGANQVYGISFGVDDPKALQGEARQDAMLDARSRAESLAQLAGVALGEVLSLSEVIGGPGPVVYESAKGMGGSAAPMEAGELEVSMSVQVTYAIH